MYKIELTDRIRLILHLFFITLVWYIFVLLKLEDQYMHLWDESRYALNTFEFLKHNNPFLVTAYGEPDWWNTKPPMSQWLQAISVKIFGYNEFGVRFPSAFFSLLTVYILIFNSKKIFSSYTIGLCAGILLFSIPEYNGYHITRTADVDSILIFFTTSYIFLIYYIIERKQNSVWIFIALSLSIIGAFYTKSIAGFIPLAACVIYILLFPKNYVIFKNPKVYIFGISTILICLSYYFIRDFYDPGYIKKAILSTEMSMYNKNNREGSDFWNSIFTFFDNKLYFYSYFLFLSPILFISKKTKQASVLLYTIGVGTLIVAIHAGSVVKKNWYDIPAIPIFMFGIAYIIYSSYKHLLSLTNTIKKTVLLILFSSGIIFSYSKAINIIYQNRFDKKNYVSEYIHDETSAFIKNKIEPRKDLHTVKFIPRPIPQLFYENVLFYSHSFQEQNRELTIITLSNITEGDTLLMKKRHPEYEKISKGKEHIIDTKVFSLFIY
ncbi:MAG: ArnT family glycosyltransferase [Bacteroidota bacterium]